MCLIVPLCGVLKILKNKKVWRLFHCKSFIVVLSIYIRTLFYFEIEKNKKGRQGKPKKIIRRNMYSTGFELTTSDSRGRCSHHCAIDDLQFSDAIFPIYRKPIFIINLTRTNLFQGNRNSFHVCQQCKNTRSFDRCQGVTVRTS